MTPLKSPEIAPRPHTPSQRKNIPNYDFHLGLLFLDEPPDTHYENPPQASVWGILILWRVTTQRQ